MKPISIIVVVVIIIIVIIIIIIWFINPLSLSSSFYQTRDKCSAHGLDICRVHTTPTRHEPPRRPRGNSFVDILLRGPPTPLSVISTSSPDGVLLSDPQFVQSPLRLGAASSEEGQTRRR